MNKDSYDDWMIQFEPETILEVKGTYHIRKKKVLPSSSEGQVKGLAASYRKCDLTFYYRVNKWPTPVSVSSIKKGLRQEILDKGVLLIQSEDTY